MNLAAQWLSENKMKIGDIALNWDIAMQVNLRKRSNQYMEYCQRTIEKTASQRQTLFKTK